MKTAPILVFTLFAALVLQACASSSKPQPSEDSAQMERTIEQMFAAFSRGDLDGFLYALADDFVYEKDGREPLHGKAAFREFASEGVLASSDAEVKPLRMVVMGNQAVAEIRYEGTHDKGTFYGLAPTGRNLTFGWAFWATFENGKIVRLKSFSDPDVLKEQLGID